jgi:hypothetical protein
MKKILIMALIMAGFCTAFSQVPTAYLTPDYSGGIVALTASYPSLDGYRCQANWTQHIASVRVPDGWTVELFEGPNYTGASTQLTSDVPNLNNLGWANRATSVKVTHGSILGDGICPCQRKAPMVSPRGRL